MTTLQALRLHAISQSLFQPTTLRAAVQRLGFIQADPIRSPAAAQDLILRHRVRNYKAGDLERRYPSLEIEEDVLYAYGFLARRVWRLLHPRNTKGLSALEKKVLDVVSRLGATHPGSLEEHFGRKRVVNAWGGYSKATTQALDMLHYRGLLRIVRREAGIRVYEAVPPQSESLEPFDRLKRLVMLVANILTPSPQKTLQAVIARHGHLGDSKNALQDLLRAGDLRREAVDGVAYLWPHSRLRHEDAPRVVRFLAPFDPLVWDRQRFEHFWQWPYRFEAYTPKAKRIRGYYAMPLLWRDLVIGWANAQIDAGSLNVEIGFVDKRPKDADFNRELDAEIVRMQSFLGVT